jgi:hypothetical protein
MQTPKNRNLILILIAAALALGCCCAVTFGGALLSAFFRISSSSVSSLEEEPSGIATVVTRVITLTPQSTEPRDLPEGTPAAAETPQASSATPEAGAVPRPTSDVAMNPANVEIPHRDLRELALRLKAGVTDIPQVVNATPPTYKVGDEAEFWVSNNDTQEHRKITAVVRYVTPHVYMWVEDGVEFDQSDLEESANRFENQTYSTNREFFGSEWTPGVDNDPHLSILHANGLGDTVAGYYSSADEFSRLVNQYSNEREMFYISAESGSTLPNTQFYDGTLAHEFQHMIHWANDRNEDSWVNEGMSELASFLNSYDPGGADIAFSQQPDTQLNTWSDPSEGNIEHYGGSYLFMSYFLDRFGEDLTKAVVASQRNGIAGFNEALEAAGRSERFADVFADWVVANYMDQPAAGVDGQYGYTEIDPNRPVTIETIRRYPAEGQTQVSQFATDYIELADDGSFTIDFAGDTETQVVDADPRGELSWWSNRGDDSNSTLTRAFDLTGVDEATLNFSTWYDIEEGWDYAYVAASTDGGKKWQLLPGRYSTEENPVGNAFGVGWTGISGGGSTPEWVEEQVDLTPFAGEEILLRFEYVTDDAVNESGLLLDDISIPEINYREDGESGAGSLESAGWLLTDNRLAQRWLVQVIRGDGDTVHVQRMEVGPDGRGQLIVEDVGRNEDVALAVSGLTQYTTEPANYSYAIQTP